MKVELFPFQKRALVDIRLKTAEALGSYHRTHAPQDYACHFRIDSNNLPEQADSLGKISLPPVVKSFQDGRSHAEVCGEKVPEVVFKHGFLELLSIKRDDT